MKMNTKNRKDQNIIIFVEEVPNPKGLAFVMHGLGGRKEQSHLQVIAEAFLENSYTVIRFDTTNTFGESYGDYEKATVTNYYEDLEDVIAWGSKQSWYTEPFILAGHSLGGICTALYAENFPDKVKALAPISTVVSGKLSMEAKAEDAEEWQRTGWREEESVSNPGTIKRLPWSHMEDRLKYDLLKNVDKLTMPVLMIVGENDTSTPIIHQQVLFDKLPGKKEFHIIPDAPHTFQDKMHIAEVKKYFDAWIQTLS